MFRNLLIRFFIIMDGLITKTDLRLYKGLVFVELSNAMNYDFVAIIPTED